MIYAIVGYAIIILMMFMILKKKATPAFCFSILPVIGALICGLVFQRFWSLSTKAWAPYGKRRSYLFSLYVILAL